VQKFSKWNPNKRTDLRREKRREKVKPKVIIEVKHLDPSGEGLSGDLKASKNSYVGKDVEKLKKWIKNAKGRKAFFVIYSVARGARGDVGKNVEEKLKELLRRSGFDVQKEIMKKACLIVFLFIPPDNLEKKWTLETFYCALKSGKRE
jgi:hypothetical protein